MEILISHALKNLAGPCWIHIPTLACLADYENLFHFAQGICSNTCTLRMVPEMCTNPGSFNRPPTVCG